jgi:hypothetical protein
MPRQCLIVGNQSIPCSSGGKAVRQHPHGRHTGSSVTEAMDFSSLDISLISQTPETPGSVERRRRCW